MDPQSQKEPKAGENRNWRRTLDDERKVSLTTDADLHDKPLIDMFFGEVGLEI